MLPDFLCIGAHKAGTTWLYHNLRQHPQIWLPPQKELHYFDRAASTLGERLRSRRGGYRHARERLLREFKTLRVLRAPGKAWWLARYLLRDRDDDWYRSLFPTRAGRLCGEMTPGYAVLDDAVVARIAGLMPHARIIYLLRDPIERAWSALYAKATMGLVGAPDAMPDGELIAWLTRRGPARHSDYLAHLERWERHFGDRVLVAFYDELSEEPAALLSRIHRFLGVAEHLPVGLEQRRNARFSGGVPERVMPEVVRAYHEQLRGLDRRFANAYTARWLASAERDLDGDRPVSSAAHD